jgi:hypothetical protein
LEDDFFHRNTHQQDLYHGLHERYPNVLSLSSARIIKGLRSFLKMPLGSRAWLGHQLLCVAHSTSPPSLDIFVESHPKPPAAIGGNGSIEEV